MGKPYYQKQNGLRFECTQCGDCCTRPGPVYMPDPEIARAAAFLGMTPGSFRRRYGVHLREDVPVVDPGPDRPCSFYDADVGCTIYEARPTQCRTWPFWAETVGRRRSWERAAGDCEGMNQGRMHSVEEIEQLLLACDEAGLPEGEPW